MSKEKNKIIMYGIFLIGSILFFSNLKCFAITDEEPKHRKAINTTTTANLLNNRSKILSTYENTKYNPVKHKFSTDLFGSNASKYKVKNRGKILKGIDSVRNIIEITYPSCNLTDKDILGILFFTNNSLSINDEIIKSIPSNRWPTTKDQQLGCSKLTKCITGGPDQNMNRSCEEIVRNAYILGFNEQAKKYILEESNLGNEKYYNGSLEDSNYDILYDMQQIAKLIYEEPASVTSVLYYKIPNFSNSNSEPQNQNEPQNNQSNNHNNSNNPTNSGNERRGNNINTGNRSQLNPTTGNNEQSKEPGINQNNTYGGIKLNNITNDEEINNFLNNYEEIRTTTSNGNTAFINQCIITGSPKLEEAYLAAEEEEIIPGKTPDEITEEELDIIYNDILENSNTIEEISPNTPLSGDKNDPNNIAGIKATSTDAETIEALKKELEKCMEKCNGLRIDEKAICKAQCLCEEYSSKAIPNNKTYKFIEEGALRIRICTIPSKAKIISTTTKNLYSIESILTELHDTIKAMLESGELTPKVKKEELLDTSLSDVKISDMINLIITSNIKKPTTERKKAPQELEELKTNLENSRAGLNIQGNPNVFNIISDNKKQSISTQESIDFSTSIKVNQLAGINNSISKFLSDNYIFLDILNSSLGGMKESLMGLTQK